MQEVTVESLERLERHGNRVRLSANAGSLSIVFSREVWERATSEAAFPAEPTGEELAELDGIRARLKRYATANSFKTVRENVPCAGNASAPEYDLVLEPSGLFAATTGYLFAPVVGRELVDRVASGLGEGVVEQAYVVGAVADDGALGGGGEFLKALSVRGRRCGASRFEMPPELWQVLSGGLGWRDVETSVHREE